ncbi:MAG: hypothetical protein E7177_06240 [Erysipelotrichaceae bacterium]|nr:hypothetical protein [Erysipelotrichaceae bacterium]
MNTAKRLQLLLSPVLIAMLALMLAVVSFGWYQAEMGDVEIEASGESVDITVEAPDYINVELTQLGDNYTYSNSSFTIDQGQKTLGYFGQTGEYDVSSNNNDKPYIMFYRVDIVAVNKEIDISTAYVDGLQIIKNEDMLVNENDWLKEQTKFMVYFYTLSNGAYGEESDSFTPTSPNEFTTYMGIHFDDPIENEFAYSDFRYYGSIYNLHIKFV